MRGFSDEASQIGFTQATDKAWSLEQALRNFFFSADQARLREHPDGADDTGTLETAVENEQQGVAMYDRLIADSRDETERAFFQSLREEEDDHQAALENVHRYLAARPASSQPDDRCAWEWMIP